MMNIQVPEMTDEVTDECKEGSQKPLNALLELHPLFAIYCRRKWGIFDGERQTGFINGYNLSLTIFHLFATKTTTVLSKDTLVSQNTIIKRYHKIINSILLLYHVKAFSINNSGQLKINIC